MKKSSSQTSFKPLDPDSDEFFDLFDALVAVLQRHFDHCANFKAKLNAHRFIATYESVMMDLWDKKQAVHALDELKRAVLGLAEARERVPTLVLVELEANAGYQDELKKQKFLERTTSDIVFKSQLPERVAHKTFDALRTLSDQRMAVLDAIELTRRNLPQGIKTRNRPLREWALIHAAADLARVHRAFNVPKAIDQTGPFYRLLCSLFDIFGIPRRTSLRGVYGGWRKFMDGKYEDFDLLDI